MKLKDYENSHYTVTAETFLDIFPCMDFDDNPEIQPDDLILIDTGFMLDCELNPDIKFKFFHEDEFWTELDIREDDPRVDWAAFEDFI